MPQVEGVVPRPAARDYDQTPAADRQALAKDVSYRAARLRRSLEVAPAFQDLAWRLAVKQTLIDRQLLRIESGGWCYVVAGTTINALMRLAHL